MKGFEMRQEDNKNLLKKQPANTILTQFTEQINHSQIHTN